MSWSTFELRVRLAPFSRFKPSGKIFYWPFQGGTSFVDNFFLACVSYAFVCVCLYVPCGHLLGKGWPLGSRFWCLTVSLSLSHWYLGSGVVLDCIDSWSLHPYLFSSWRPNLKYSIGWLIVHGFEIDRVQSIGPIRPVGLLLWIFYVFFSVSCLLCTCARLFICALWSPAGKGLTSWLSFVVSNCEYVTFSLVSRVRCGTWLYRFLILLTLK